MTLSPREEQTTKMEDWREAVIDCVPKQYIKSGHWKYEYFDYCDGPTLAADCDMFFQEAEQRGKTKNHRVYIGPGSDGSSDDKIAVD